MNYSYIASPYLIVIFAEVHFGLVGLDMIVEIIDAVYREVKALVYGRLTIERESERGR